jgi:NAD(P)-dependent dehydrogenase (short-subunit alcohol dehydrogenase family)
VNSEELTLAGKVVLFTGAGRGIGEACARYAAERGATVVINDIDIAVAEQVASAISAGAGDAIAMPCDVSDWGAVDGMIAAVVDRYGRLDGLVNNAALFRMAMVEESSPELWDLMLRTNVVGVAACGQRAAQQMVAQGRGSIVNITSGAQCGMEAMSIYGATKAAVASLTYTWAIELAPAGVRVNAVSPRAATRMFEQGQKYRPLLTGTQAPVGPTPRMNAPAVAYLLSDLSEGVTGQVVRVEGDSLGLMTHPAVSVPMVVDPEWDVVSVSKVFDANLRHRQLPPGVVGLRPSEPIDPGDPEWNVSVQELSGQA